MVKYDFILSATNFDKLNVSYQTKQPFSRQITIKIVEKNKQFSCCNNTIARTKKFWFGVTSEKFNLFFRKNEIYVEFNAIALWKYNILCLHEELISLFQKHNIEIIQEKVMRADFAIDFYYEKNLINALKKKNNIKLSTQKEGETTYKNNLSITYGKSPNNSVVIYNKTAEILLHESQNFNQKALLCRGELYRIEYRIGRFLLNQYGITDVHTLTINYFNLLFKLMEKEPIVSTHKKIKKNGIPCKVTFNRCRMWISLMNQIKEQTQQDIKKLTKIKLVPTPEKKAENVEKYLARAFEETKTDPTTKMLVEQVIIEILQTYGSTSIII